MRHIVFVITPFGDDYIALFNELKEYFNGIELVDGFTLGFGVNGEIMPIPSV